MFSFFICTEREVRVCESMIKQKGEFYMEADFQVIDNYLMVKMPAEIDHHQSGAISRKADSFLLRDSIQGIVFDFEDTKFMDSSGVGIIMGRYKKISCLGGRIYAIHADRQIRRILYISGLSKIVEIME